MTHLSNDLLREMESAPLERIRRANLEDPLAPAEGLINGLIISLCLWGVIWFGYHIIRAAIR